MRLRFLTPFISGEKMQNQVKIIQVDPSEILLPPENPRHEYLPSQEEITYHLCQDEQVLELAKSIVEEGGTNPLDLPGLVQKGSDSFGTFYEVGEGNRRICAIHLLNDPDKAPPRQRRRFRLLAENYEPISTITAVLFRKRSELHKWEQIMHQGEQGGAGRKRWPTESKAKHHKGYSIAISLLDRAEELGFLTGEQRKGKVSTLSRYVQNSEMKKALGIKGDPTEKLESTLTKDIFEALLNKLIRDLLDRNITSRDNNPQIIPYAQKLIEEFEISADSTRWALESSKPDPNNQSSKQKRSVKSPTFIRQSDDLWIALEKIKSQKLSHLYSSICNIRADNHVQLVALGCWALVESLTALAGRAPDVSFPDFYSKSKASSLGVPQGRYRTISDCLKRVSGGGNTTKHDHVAGTFNYSQLINDMEALTPILIATIDQLENRTSRSN